MPVVQRFNGFVIRMYFEDHNPPHVHVVGPDFEARVGIGDREVLEGTLPPKFRKDALDWIAANKAALLKKWEELQ
jgi:Domain of unknown function (DUF4160)